MATQPGKREKREPMKPEGMMITQLTLENVKKLRGVKLQIDPSSGKLIQITGKNGQGKTTVLDMIWFLLKGQKALPDKKQTVIRNGAERMRCRMTVKGDNIEFTVTRSLGRDG